MFLEEIHHCDVTAFDTFTVAGTTLSSLFCKYTVNTCIMKYFLQSWHQTIYQMYNLLDDNL